MWVVIYQQQNTNNTLTVIRILPASGDKEQRGMYFLHSPKVCLCILFISVALNLCASSQFSHPARKNDDKASSICAPSLPRQWNLQPNNLSTLCMLFADLMLRGPDNKGWCLYCSHSSVTFGSSAIEGLLNIAAVLWIPAFDSCPHTHTHTSRVMCGRMGAYYIARLFE